MYNRGDISEGTEETSRKKGTRGGLNRGSGRMKRQEELGADCDQE